MTFKKLILAIFIVILGTAPVFADAGYWEAVEREIRLVLSEAYYRYVAGDAAGAAALVDAAF